jgi:tetratricopeptide (TPR) repeat protein
MGGKSRYLIILAILVALPAKAQVTRDFRTIDSVTYNLWLNKDWDMLIDEGRSALRSGVDYKFLRQRLGHAYFEKGDYSRAARHFSKALPYDSYNAFTLEYLYYSYLNQGKEEYAGVLAGRIDPLITDLYGMTPAKLIDRIELELNYKLTSTKIRSDASYYRIGIRSRLSPRVVMYQAYSGYNQTINNNLKGDTAAFRIRQPSYYLLLNWNISRHLMIRSAYHYLHTVTGYRLSRGNLFHLAVAPDLGDFGFEVNGSVTTYGKTNLYQAGLNFKYVFPGRQGFYMKGISAVLASEGERWSVMGTSAGMKLWKGSVIEGSVMRGELAGYNDFNGMYVYNSYDPIISRTGVTLYQLFGTGTGIWLNYGIEKKEYFEARSFTYNQFSFLGGVRWKI